MCSNCFQGGFLLNWSQDNIVGIYLLLTSFNLLLLFLGEHILFRT